MGSPLESMAIARGGLAVEIMHNERDAEQWLKNFLQKVQSETGNIKALSLLGFSQLFEERLGILCSHQLIKIVVKGRPLGNECDCEHKREPKGRNERSAPQRAFKPGKIASAMGEISAITQ